MAQISDVITAVAALFTAVVGIGTLIGIRHQLKEQSAQKDMTILLEFHQRVGDGWGKTNDASLKKEERNFHFGQLLAYYETVCYFSNRKMLGSNADQFLADHIIEVFAAMTSDPDRYEEMMKIKSGPDTYKEIHTFLKKHKSKTDQHKQFLREAKN